jgi:hypothetical protein
MWIRCDLGHKFFSIILRVRTRPSYKFFLAPSLPTWIVEARINQHIVGRRVEAGAQGTQGRDTVRVPRLQTAGNWIADWLKLYKQSSPKFWKPLHVECGSSGDQWEVKHVLLMLPTPIHNYHSKITGAASVRAYTTGFWFLTCCFIHRLEIPPQVTGRHN